MFKIKRKDKIRSYPLLEIRIRFESRLSDNRDKVGISINRNPLDHGRPSYPIPENRPTDFLRKTREWSKFSKPKPVRKRKERKREKFSNPIPKPNLVALMC